MCVRWRVPANCLSSLSADAVLLQLRRETDGGIDNEMDGAATVAENS